MRAAEEREAWRKLKKRNLPTPDLPVSVLLGAATDALEIDQDCLVLAGLNGAGKTQALDAAAAALGDSATHIRLHEDCEQVRSILSTRDDLADLADETGPLTLDPDMAAALRRIIGRDYDTIEWYALELVTSDDEPQGWPDPDGTFLVPYFQVIHDGHPYSSLQMGLGEFSVHLLFWRLWLEREAKRRFLVLDEPDTYLPPRTRLRLLAYLLNFVLRREWYLLISSHSEAVLEEAIANDSLVVLLREGGLIKALRTADHGRAIAAHLLAPLTIGLVLFVEDEVAYTLTCAILEHFDPTLADTTQVTWKDGQGYLNVLSKTLPRTKHTPVRFALAYDGDQRPAAAHAGGPSAKNWPKLYLPDAVSPDALLRTTRTTPEALAAALGCDLTRLKVVLSDLEGSEDHDWVEGICTRFGPRVGSLRTLCQLWVQQNEAAAKAFCDAVKRAAEPER